MACPPNLYPPLVPPQALLYQSILLTPQSRKPRVTPTRPPWTPPRAQTRRRELPRPRRRPCGWSAFRGRGRRCPYRAGCRG